MQLVSAFRVVIGFYDINISLVCDQLIYIFCCIFYFDLQL